MTDILATIPRPSATFGGITASVLPVAGPIVGRDREIEQLVALLDDENVRVLSLLGPGGVGKTRLAQEVMRQAGDDFAHGAAFVALAPVRSPDLVPHAVAQALGVQERGEVSLTALLAEWLQPRHLLLVLDNMEHVVDIAYPWLTDLIASCPRLKVLVTSRIPLDITGEQRFPVRPLPVPGDDATERIDENASVRLFTTRAREIRPDFALNDATSHAVAGICTRVDGLPLAIELAASRVAAFSPSDILSQLTESLASLAGTRRDAPPRLRSMHDAIAWSYDLLDPDAQDLFRRLAVFIGGFSLEGAEAVGADPKGPAARPEADVVATLVDHSLVDHLDHAGHSRFRMLETIREFGLAQLTEREALAEARDRHAMYCVHLAELAKSGLRGPDQATWHALLDIERGNLREAMDWLTETGRVADAIELFSNIEQSLLIRAHLSESRRLLDGWLAMPELGHRTRARALALVASVKLAFAMEMADPPIWLLLEEAIDIFRELDDRYQVMAALDFFSYYLALVDDRARARAAHEEHLTLAQELGDAWSETQALGNLAIIAGHEGDSTRARSLLEATLARARESGDLCRIALTLDHLGGLALHDTGDPGRSRVLFEECRDVRERLGDKRNMSLTYLDLALVYRAGGDLNRAREHACTAVSLAQDTGLVTHGGAAHAELGKIALLQHDPARALVELRQALESYRGVDPGISPEVVDCLDSVAELALQTGDTEAAARFLCASDELIRRAGLPRLKTWPANYHQAMIARVRRTLDAESFEHHRAAAIEWSLDEAIAAALAWEPAIETPDQAGTPATHHGLSPREIEVLRLMAAGLSNQEIADALYISRRTATSHASHILDKLDLTSRTQAVAWAIRNGIA